MSEILGVEGLSVRYVRGRSAHLAVDDVSFSIAEGESLGLVGESGSGKSTVARAVVGIVGVHAGSVRVDGQAVRLGTRRGRAQVRACAQLVFQNPLASLNPRMTVGELVAEAVRARRSMPRAAVTAEVRRLLGLVALDPQVAARYPHEFSGGQRQRIALARTLGTQPRVLLADEITSALDVSVQASVLNLLRSLQAQLGLSMVFISHDLAVVRNMCHAVAVMHRGRLVEQASCDDLFAAPRHPYTAALLDAVPRMHEARGTTPERWLHEPQEDPHALGR